MIYLKPIKPISISLSPNVQKDDILISLKLIFQPWRWRSRSVNWINSLENIFKDYLGVKYAFSFNSGRSALLAILSSLQLKEGDEVLLQAFTCNAVVNPVIWSGLKPVYVDCDKKTFNIDIIDLKKKITSKSKVLIVQHTFGLPENLKEILKICQEKKLILIEDCAHSLGAKFEGKKVGTFGKVSFFSFSRDKVISCVYGGMAATNDEIVAKKLYKYQQNIKYPSRFWIFQQLLHPILMNFLILPSYRILGKYLLYLFQKLGLLSKAIHQKEKNAEKPRYFPKKLPPVLAFLALNQLKKVETFNNHRKLIAQFYRKEIAKLKGFELPIEKDQIYLRFTVKHSNAYNIIKKAWRNNLLLGDWYNSPVAPKDTKLERVGYIKGSCLNSEELAKKILNLPTHINISLKVAEKVVEFLRKNSND